MRRAENAIACGATSLYLVAALPDCAMAGALGQWASTGLHAAFGYAAWLVPAWLADVCRRAWVGAPRDPRRTVSWVFHSAAACMTLELCRGHGGWVGEQCASILWTTIGIGAYVIASGVWVVAALRVLGPRRVQQVAVQATVIARQVLAHRPALLLPVSTQSLRAEVVEAYAEPVPVPARAPVPASAPIRAEPPAPPPPPAAAAPRTPSHWQLPRVDMLPPAAPHHVDQAYLMKAAGHITAKLATYDLLATVSPALEQGSLISRFDVAAGRGQKLRPIKERQEDLEAEFAGLSFVDLPGSGRLGIEIPIPAKLRTPIQMREVLDTSEWIGSTAALPLALGVTTTGKPVVVDLAKCPHLLVAGSTGGGKSVGLNVMLTSLLLSRSPSDLRLALIDPKKVELARYRDVPHLLRPTITDVSDAIAFLSWAVDEMERRYDTMLARDVNELDEYNALDDVERLARNVIVIDEYADLTSVAKKEVEAILCRLAQKARAAGIHIILATQRPSVDVITGAIKTNFPSRIAYRVPQREDSKVILGTAGAQRLIGNGDSLCLLPGKIELTRVHGAYVSNECVRRICEWWRAQTTTSAQRQVPAAPPPLPARAAVEPSDEEAGITVDDAVVERLDDSAVVDEPEAKAPSSNSASAQPPADPYDRATTYARERGHVSGRQLEKLLRVGKNRADQLVQRMRDAALIEPGGPNNSYRYIGPTA